MGNDRFQGETRNENQQVNWYWQSCRPAIRTGYEARDLNDCQYYPTGHNRPEDHRNGAREQRTDLPTIENRKRSAELRCAKRDSSPEKNVDQVIVHSPVDLFSFRAVACPTQSSRTIRPGNPSVSSTAAISSSVHDAICS